MPDRKKRIIWVLFCLYCAGMLWLLFGREVSVGDVPYMEQIATRFSLRPFGTIWRQLRRAVDPSRPWLMRHSIINLVGNVVLFVPLGVFLPLLWKPLGRLWRVMALTAAVIILVETAQVVTLLGRGDIDDVILNVLGAAIGYGLYRRMGKKCET